MGPGHSVYLKRSSPTVRVVWGLRGWGLQQEHLPQAEKAILVMNSHTKLVNRKQLSMCHWHLNELVVLFLPYPTLVSFTLSPAFYSPANNSACFPRGLLAPGTPGHAGIRDPRGKVSFQNPRGHTGQNKTQQQQQQQQQTLSDQNFRTLRPEDKEETETMGQKHPKVPIQQR